MASSLTLTQTVLAALKYSQTYNYPLTAKEVWLWQPFSNFSLTQIHSELVKLSNSQQVYCYNHFYQLSPRPNLSLLRIKRQLYSSQKIAQLHRYIRLLSFLPTIQAIFLTGSVAALNAKAQDDIDIFIVTLPHTLWITRLILVSALKLLDLRRPPYLSSHSSPQVQNRLCDNLWLDTNHLYVPCSSFLPHNLYLSHEIIQAMPIFDRAHVSYRLLRENLWVQKYLPIISSRKLSATTPQTSSHFLQSLLPLICFAPNFLCFLAQYVYMFPKLTQEKVGLGFAYFHPQGPPKRKKAYLKG